MQKIKFLPHQNDVLNQTLNFNHVAYYLDMGLGKTFVGAEKLYLLNNAVNLVICQKSKIDDWVDHFKTYYPDYQVLNLTKKAEAVTFRTSIEEMKLYDDRNTLDVVGVVNYETAFRRSWLLDLEDFTLMLDESSLISNEKAKRSRFILKMKPESVVLLSGTPTAGKYEKLWSQCKLLGWDIGKKAFWKSYVETEWVDYGAGFMQEVVTGYKNVRHLKKKLAEHGAVFMKTEEVLTLPEQIEQTIFVKKSKEYNRFMKEGYVVIGGHWVEECGQSFHGEDKFVGGTELVGDNSLTKMLYARQLCGQYHKDKLNAFMDLVESTNDRLIVFYNFTAELEAMQKILSDLDRPYSVVNGSKKDLTAYNQDDNSITFIQYQAGAMGGNYQKANKIIYFTLPLGKGSCDLWEQSKKRIHRIGQKNTCFYYYLMVKGSIEEHNFEMLKLGKELTDDLFERLEEGDK